VLVSVSSRRIRSATSSGTLKLWVEPSSKER
jgi:hypothetical protein